jgi:hypothetical protein
MAAGRIAVGVALTVAPGTAGRRWIGPSATDPSVKVMTRAMGARDLALGFGTLRAIEDGAPLRTWAVLGVLSDGVDAVATLLALRRLGRGALPVLATATLAAVAGVASLDRLD